MSVSKTLAASRREVLKTGAAAVGMAAVGLPITEAMAAPGPRPSLATPAGQQMLAIYEKAVGLMKDPKINNPPQPQSWTFQAYIHSLPINPTDPNSKGYKNGTAAFIAKVDSIYGINPTGPAAEWKKAALACWSTCTHGSPYFLPWHRWYMFYFEQIIRTVANAPDFSLPYWDYAANTSTSLQLPAAFQDPKSPLYESIRGLGFADPVKPGKQDVPMNKIGYLAFSQVDYRPSLVATQFYPAYVGNIVFPPDPAWEKYGYSGRTETVPHDNVHDGVGGLMGNVPTAAADPIFYMHHCQIDHLWASWQSYAGNDKINFGQPPGTPDQPSADTFASQLFSFVDGTGKLVQVRLPGAVDYKALGYSYDNLAPKPGSEQVAAAASAAGAPILASTTPTGTPATLAKQAAVKVGAGGTTLTLTPSAPPAAKDSKLTASVPATPSTVVLNDVTLVKRPPAPLHVFVNLPKGAAPDISGPHYAGTISLFKLEVGEGGGSHAGHGGADTGLPDIRIHVGKALEAQRKAGTWTGGPVTVTVATAGAPDTAGDTYLSVGSVELTN